MSSYFLGYIEVQADTNGHWKLLRFGKKDDTDPVGAPYICQGYMRDLLSQQGIGTRVCAQKDPDFAPKPGDTSVSNGLSTYRPKERYVVNDNLCSELTNKINIEWDPEQDEKNIFWWGPRSWYKITLGELKEKYDELFDGTLEQLEETYKKESESNICKRLDTIEDVLRQITPESVKEKPRKKVNKYEDNYYDPSWRNEIIETLKYDIGSLSEMIGFLDHLRDIGDYNNIRIIAAID